MDQFEQQLDELLKAGKTAEAKKLIEDLIAAPLSEKDQGAVAFNRAMVYIRAKNELNKQYIAKAKEILAELNDLDQLQRDTDKSQKIDDIRSQIKGM